MNNNKVSIATKPLVYSAFRYIENKVWNALAEYVYILIIDKKQLYLMRSNLDAV